MHARMPGPNRSPHRCASPHRPAYASANSQSMPYAASSSFTSTEAFSPSKRHQYFFHFNDREGRTANTHEYQVAAGLGATGQAGRGAGTPTSSRPLYQSKPPSSNVHK
eukprot:1377112-Prymnesium_polylepis.1